MFNILRNKKPNLTDIIHKNYVDIHSHILPGVDDGAKEIGESIKMINDMSSLGFKKIIATPHTYPGLYENTNDTIFKSFKTLKKELNSDFLVDYASEYLLDFSLIEKSEKKNLLTLKENYVLVEMSYMGAPIRLDDIIFSILTNDYIPVLAHPERYRFFFNDFNLYKKLKKYGFKFQINLLSTTGYYGPEVLKITNKLLENKMVDFVGSDIHNSKHIEIIKGKRVLIKNIRELENCIIANDFFFENST